MSSLPSSVGPAACGTGKTTRMIEYAISQARAGEKLTIIVNSAQERDRVYKYAKALADKAGCGWVVGDGSYGGPDSNIEIRHVRQVMVKESLPGDYQVCGTHDREILVDNTVYEDRYAKVLENYQRWV